ncbi:MAG: hypothetical protein MJK10_08345 [Pseudomonadales bacterium]|nr:hypothetical protein [Pseudomonadales bacterium]NRA15836.1 hypothetical protein [Oceanospirillaceae bacterium]
MYKSHGESKVERKGNLLIINSKGPFNLQFVQNYNRDIESVIAQMPEVWGQVVTVYQDSLLTPEAEKELKLACKYRKNRGCCISGVVFSENGSSFVTRGQLTRVYDYAGIKFKFFNDLLLAEQWVVANLATV